jgi:hypothetical protein
VQRGRKVFESMKENTADEQSSTADEKREGASCGENILTICGQLHLQLTCFCPHPAPKRKRPSFYKGDFEPPKRHAYKRKIMMM